MNGERTRKKRQKSSYNKISNSTRQRLIEMVYVNDYQLKEASMLLGINYSSAKTILRIFRLEKRHMKKNKRGELEQDPELSEKDLNYNLSQVSSQKDIYYTRRQHSNSTEVQTDPLCSPKNKKHSSNLDDHLIKLNDNFNIPEQNIENNFDSQIQEFLPVFLNSISMCEKTLGYLVNDFTENQKVLIQILNCYASLQNSLNFDNNNNNNKNNNNYIMRNNSNFA